MADLIERTEELILAVNAGARAIENTKRYHGATYCLDVFSDKPKEIPYLKAAQILRGFDEVPAVDAVEVVRCKDCKYWKSYGGSMKYYGECEGTSKTEMWAEDDFCSHGERREENELVER